MTNDQNAQWPERIHHGHEQTAYVRYDIHDAVVKELSTTRAQLRIECQVENCNDWPDDLHLADVIEKHLCRKMAYERDALQRQLAQCRREALEEAAKACESLGNIIHKNEAADAIRKLIEKEGGTTPPRVQP